MTRSDPEGTPGGTRGLPALASRAQLGDRTALEDLLRRLQEPLFDHIRGIVRDADLAADVLQDTLLLVCRRLNTVREGRWVRAWAYRIATREAIRALRRRRCRGEESPIEELLDLPVDAAQEEEVAPELLAELPRRLDALPAGAQVVLRLHYLQELTQAEVAEPLEIPLGTVKSRIAYGLAALRRDWASAR